MGRCTSWTETPPGLATLACWSTIPLSIRGAQMLPTPPPVLALRETSSVAASTSWAEQTWVTPRYSAQTKPLRPCLLCPRRPTCLSAAIATYLNTMGPQEPLLPLSALPQLAPQLPPAWSWDPTATCTPAPMACGNTML